MARLAETMPSTVWSVNLEPQNQRKTTYICWDPWMTQARKAHVATGTLPRGLLVMKELGSLDWEPTFTAEIEGEKESTA